MARKEDPQADLIAAFEFVAGSAQGRAALREVFRQSGYDKPLMIYNEATGLQESASLHNLASRELWYRLRQHLSPTNRSRIENQED